MFDALQKLLISLAPFTNEEMQEAATLLQVEKIEKGKFFIKSGMIADRIGFVNSGLMRSFYTINGKETTTFFQFPGLLASALVSFLKMKPSNENIQAIEDTEIVYILRKDLYTLYEKNWKWQQVGRVMTENYYVLMEERIISLQSQSASERYQMFQDTYPELLNSIPLYYIASYLGMSPETLSRIRKN